MKGPLKKEAKRQKEGRKLASERQSAWAATSIRIDQALAEFAEQWKAETGESHYIERSSNRYSPHGIYTFNANCISIRGGNSYTGIGEREGFSTKLVIEKSGLLMFTQFPDGRIMVLATPTTSDLKELPFSRILVFSPLEPSEITYETVNKALKEYLWLQRITKSVTFPNFGDRMRLFRYWIVDWRHSNDWKTWVGFWVAIATLVFSFLALIASLLAL